MMTVNDIRAQEATVAAQIDELGRIAMAIKQQRDDMEFALKAILLGCDLVLSETDAAPYMEAFAMGIRQRALDGLT